MVGNGGCFVSSNSCWHVLWWNVFYGDFRKNIVGSGNCDWSLNTAFGRKEILARITEVIEMEFECENCSEEIDENHRSKQGRYYLCYKCGFVKAMIYMG